MNTDGDCIHRIGMGGRCEECVSSETEVCAACGNQLESVFDETRKRNLLVCPDIDKRNLLGHTITVAD